MRLYGLRANHLSTQSGLRFQTCAFPTRSTRRPRGLSKGRGFAMGGTDVFYIASAYYYHSTFLLLKAARVLGYAQDIARYGKLRTGFVGTAYLCRTLAQAGLADIVTRITPGGSMK